MKRAIIIGAGGHGREVAEILHDQARLNGALSVLGFIDDDPSLDNQIVDGLPVLGGWQWFDGVDRSEIRVISAVGSPCVARRLHEQAAALGLKFVSAISPVAQVSPYAIIEEGIAIFPHVIVNTGAHLGSHCILNVGVTVSHDASVGRYCNLNPGVHLAGNVSIGEGCYIGMGSNVIQGRSIGPWSVVGAGAVINRDLPANVTAVGVPARVIKIKGEKTS
jgi:sugar O-acyltransferase (sialic acid O-acetyltransferase NeuD family)